MYRTSLLARCYSEKSVLSDKLRRYMCKKACLVPPPSWSLDDLQLSTKTTKSIVYDADVEALCKLSCINLEHSKTSIQSVVDDINVILRCAESIKGGRRDEGSVADVMNAHGYQDRSFTDNKLQMDSLREDVADSTSYKEILLGNAIGRKQDYYSVPNVNAKKS